MNLKYGIIASGTAATITLMTTAMWAWHNAGWLSADAAKPDVTFYAVRTGAFAVAAGGQVVLLTLVVDQIYRRGAVGLAVRVSAGLVCTLAMVAAIALALAGR